jgi:hypothetical protein
MMLIIGVKCFLGVFLMLFEQLLVLLVYPIVFPYLRLMWRGARSCRQRGGACACITV